MSDTNKAGLIPIRAVRVPDDIWLPAMDAAADNGEPLSEAIRRFLIDYTRATKGPRATLRRSS